MDSRLFGNQTYEQLRENFVRARFGQKDVFGREDVEEWLTAQRQMERHQCEQDRDCLFSLCMQRVVPPQEAELVLQKCATPLNPREISPRDSDEVILLALCAALPKERTQLFLTSDEYLFAFFRLPDPSNSQGEEMTILLETADCKLDSDSSGFYIWVEAALEYEWINGRPRWEAAREFLCDRMAAVIAEERLKAEADFDRAVACSADGRKIVCADYVSIEDVGGTHVFDATLRVDRDVSLRRNKIPLVDRGYSVVREIFGVSLIVNRIHYPDPPPEGLR